MKEVRSRTLSKAAEIVGGPDALRRRLNVSALLETYKTSLKR